MATNNSRTAVGVSRTILDLGSDFFLVTSLDTFQLTSLLGKAMKSTPLLGPFGDSEFYGFFSVENIDRLGAMMFQTSDNSQLCIALILLSC